MFLRKPTRQPAPEPKPDRGPAWRRQVNNIIETQIARYPLLVQLRAVWRQLQDERESWPLLIPALLILFVGFYRAERRKVRAVIADIKD